MSKPLFDPLSEGVRLLLAVALTAVAMAAEAATTVSVGRYFEPGYCERLEDGTLVGVNEDYVRRIAEYSGWQVEWVPGGYHQLLQQLQDGTIDVLPGVAVSEERLQRFRFPRLSMGMRREYLFARQNSPYDSPGFAAWNDVVVGTGPGVVADAVLRGYLDQQRIKCDVRKYATFGEAILGYFRGECQILYSVGLDVLSAQKIVHAFPPTTVYVAVANSRPDVFADVESAMDRISVETPGFNESVHRRHFMVRRANTFYLTEAERLYLRRRVTSGSVITIEISPTVAPLKEWNAETGEASGFVKALVDELERRIGIRFRFLPPADAETVRTRYEQGEFDLWATYNADLAGLPLTYDTVESVTLPRVIVCRASERLSVAGMERAAIARMDYARFRAGHPTAVVGATVYDSLEDCIRAVRDGKADYTTCPASRAANLFRELKTGKALTIRPIAERLRRVPFRFAFSPRCDPVLASILTKALASIDLNDTESCMAEALVEKASDDVSVPIRLTGYLFWLAGLTLLVVGIVVVNRARAASESLSVRERAIVGRDLMLTAEARKLMTSVEIITSRAELIRKPDVKREQTLGWTAEILRQSEKMIHRFNAFRQEVADRSAASAKLRKIRGGGRK